MYLAFHFIRRYPCKSFHTDPSNVVSEDSLSNTDNHWSENLSLLTKSMIRLFLSVGSTTFLVAIEVLVHWLWQKVQCKFSVISWRFQKIGRRSARRCERGLTCTEGWFGVFAKQNVCNSWRNRFSRLSCHDRMQHGSRFLLPATILPTVRPLLSQNSHFNLFWYLRAESACTVGKWTWCLCWVGWRPLGQLESLILTQLSDVR